MRARANSWTLVAEQHGYALWRTDAGGWTMTGIDRRSGQVRSAMPGDMPMGGGVWVARLGDSGIDYVSRPYSRSYAHRVYRKTIAKQIYS